MQIFHSSIIFWAAWVIIPIVMEIIPTIGNFVILIKKKIVSHKEKAVNFSPENHDNTGVQSRAQS